MNIIRLVSAVILGFSFLNTAHAQTVPPLSETGYTVQGQFNFGTDDDLFVQPGTSTDSGGLYLGSDAGSFVPHGEPVVNGYLGLNWSADKVDIYPGVFKKDNEYWLGGNSSSGVYEQYIDLFLQGKLPGDTHALVTTDSSGNLNVQNSWQNGYLGINWDAASVDLYFYKYTPGFYEPLDVFVQGKRSSDNHYLVINSAGSAPDAIARTIPSDYLGLEWSAQTHVLHFGDFNGDGLNNEVLLQPKRSLLILAGPGSIPGTPISSKPRTDLSIVRFNEYPGADIIERSIAADHLGLDWYSDKTNIIVGDFNGDGKDDVFLQAKSATGTHYLLLNNGITNFTTITQSFQDGHLGLTYSGDSVTINVKDVNGDGRDDLVLSNKTGSTVTTVTAVGSSGFTASSVINTKTPNIIKTELDLSRVTHTPGTTTFGSLGGSFDVGANGSANYSVPIQIPPGMSGMQPQLALSFTSQGGNGLLGVGWSLGGLSTIHRCGKMLYNDGEAGGINFDSNDRLCLDGQRLILVSGIYGADGAYYRTENDSFAIIRGYKDFNSADAWFTMKTKAGQTFQYGAVDNARANISSQAAAVAWGVNRITDAVGNYISFSYQKDSSSGEHIPLRIDYTKNDGDSTYIIDTNSSNSVPLNTQHSVRFVYEGRDDARYGYTSGASTASLKRLAAIETYFAEQRILSYRMYYENSPDTGNSRLQKMELCNAADECFPATQFNWQNGDINLYVQKISTTFCAGDTGYQTSNADPNCFTSDQWASIQYPDITGDSIPDVCYRGTAGLRCHKGTGNGFEPTPFIDSNICSSTDTTGCNSANNYKSIRYLDVNGDSKDDLVYRSDTVGVKVWYSDGNNFVNPADSGICKDYDLTYQCNEGHYDQLHYADVNGDSLPDLCVRSSSGIRCFLNNNGAFDKNQQINTTICKNGGSAADGVCSAANNHLTVRFMDMNADGMADLVYRGDVGGMQIWYSNGKDFVGHYNSGGMCADFSNAHGGCNHYTAFELYYPDINADGLPDICMRPGSGIRCYYNTGKGFDQSRPVLTDFCTNDSRNSKYGGCNSDDNTVTIQFTDVTLDGYPELCFRANTGFKCFQNVHGQYFDTQNILDSGGMCGTIANSPSPACNSINNHKYIRFEDINADGLPDFTYRGDTGIEVWLATGDLPDQLTNITDAFGNQTNITYGSLMDPALYTPGVQGVDCIFPEMCVRGPMRVVQEYTASNGIGGEGRYSYLYQDLRAHNMGRGLLGFVSNIKLDHQTNIRMQTTWSLQGKNNLVVKGLNGLPMMTYIDKGDYPTQGMPLQTTTTYAGNGQLMEETINNVDYFYTEGLARFPYFTDSKTTKYDFDTGVPVVEMRTENYYDTAANKFAGTISRVLAVTTDKITGETFSIDTSNTYAQDNHTYTVWHLGRLTASTATHSGHGDIKIRSAASSYYSSGLLHYSEEEPLGTDTEYVKTITDYDAFGHAIKTIVQNRDGSLQRESTTQYVSGTEGTANPQIESFNVLGHREVTTMDARFGVNLSLLGPNGIATSWQYDNFGRISRESRADGTYTDTWRDWCTPASCEIVKGEASDPDIQPSYVITTQSSGTVPARAYYDQLGREVRVATEDIAGRTLYRDTVYDEASRTRKTSINYFAGNDPLMWNDFYYDEIGRIDMQDDVNGTITVNDYNGLTTTTTMTVVDGFDSNITRDQVTVKTNYADGNIRRLIDPMQGEVHYFYDAVGNLVKTRAPKENPGDHSVSGDYVETTIQYDLKGRKTSMLDPDMGSWSYEYDAFGNLIKQTDAKGQVTMSVYDQLDRIVLRIEPEGISKWVYDTATGAGIGKLHIMAGPIPYQNPTDYQNYLTTPPNPDSIVLNGEARHYKEAVYNSLGQTISVTTRIHDGYDAQNNPVYQTFQVDRNYDQYSRVKQVIYPTNVRGDRLIVENEYHALTGTLIKVFNPVPDGSGQQHTYWQLGENGDYASAVNARGQVEVEKYGNGLINYYDYDIHSGLVKNIGTSDINVQDNSYVFDSIGNLQQRVNRLQQINNQDLNEVFSYDDLNRLTEVKLNGATSQSFSYNAAGNITHNSRFGWYYDYSSGGPHAVNKVYSDPAKTQLVTQYSYDANGNLENTQQGLSGPIDRALSYTSYNKPQQIVRTINGESKLYSFYYGSARNRYKQVTPDKTIYYLRPGANAGAHFERENKGGAIKDIHYIYAGGSLVAQQYIEQDLTSAITTKLYYVHKDHLGSLEVLTDATGAVVERHSFAPFGDRRHLDWNLSGAEEMLQSASTRYGFTGHEHLDDVGLIHMNGRVYDPKLARFVSADPNIQAPENSQNFNRYTYVNNNPLSYTDPSGFFFKKIARAIAKPISGFVRRNRQKITQYLVYAIAAITQQYWLIGAYTYAQTGDLRAAAIATAQAYALQAIGDANLGTAKAAVLHGVVSGTVSELNGGSFSSGFAAGFAGKYLGDKTPNSQYYVVEGIKRATIGGVTSVLGGGKFSNGAESAAINYVFNDWQHRIERNGGYDPNDVRGGFNEFGESLVYHPDNYDPSAAGACILAFVACVAPEFIISNALTSISVGVVSGRIFYVGEGAESLARITASQTGYKTIFDTWYGKVGATVTPFLSQKNSRAMWDFFSKRFASGAKQGDDIITVFGRHRSTGAHTLPINSQSVWKRIEYPTLKSKGIPYRALLTE